MTFDATSITDLQSCSRKFRLNSLYRPLRWNPRYLLDAILRQSVLHLSRGRDVHEVRTTARSQYLQSAANPGLDVPNPYPIAMEYITLLDVLITALPRLGIPQGLESGRVIPEHSWSLSSFAGRDELHRWITVDHWDEARQRAELHSWWVAGDVAAANLPMMIHVLEIGQMRKGQRSSLWVRGYRHPKMANVKRVRFQMRSREGSFRAWTPVRLADLRMDVEEWVEMLFEDEVPQLLTRTIRVAPPDPHKQGRTFLHDLEYEYARAGQLSPVWSELPMSRGSCDGFVPCPFQSICYEDVDPETSGLFVPREALKIPQTASRPLSAKV